MAEAPSSEAYFTVEQYFRLVDEGVLRPDDRVELLEGVIVAMSPHNTPHAAGVRRATAALFRAVEGQAVIQVQLTMVLRPRSAPEPDVAVLAGTQADYDRAHPESALLVVEVADTSLGQDRITKVRIYVAAAIPEYWIVNLRDDQVEVLRSPQPRLRKYADRRVARRGERIELLALPGASVAVDDLLPSPPPPDED